MSAVLAQDRSIHTEGPAMTGRSTSNRALVAGGVGNVVEWYDFAVYGAFATVIATTYFPGADPIAGLSASFAVFATAFLARPVGAVVFGRLGDRVGRRQVLVIVIVLMAAATAGIGLLPGHAAIGVLAPVLLVAFRAAQGLSVGGEAAGATAFVVEYAPEGRRGWYGSWLWSTLALGVAGGIGAAVLLAQVFPREVLEDRGWRLAFLVALPLGLVGLYLRLRLDETPRFRAVARADGIVRRPVAVTLRAYPGRLLLGLAPVAAASLTFNLYFFYLPSHLATALGVPLSRTLAAALVGLVVVAALAPPFGRLSDRVGRRPLLVAGTAALLLAVVPAFLLIRGAEPAGLVLGYVLVALPLASLVVVPVYLAELFPTPVRSTALAISYGLGSALFGGTAPLLATVLVRRTGSPVAPAIYAVAVAVAAVAAAMAASETAFRPLGTAHRSEAEPARPGR
jgi:MFS transporter, MHS family, proline/betaine transporter